MRGALPGPKRGLSRKDRHFGCIGTKSRRSNSRSPQGKGRTWRGRRACRRACAGKDVRCARHPFEAALDAQRVSARGELGVLQTGGRTRIERLYQEGAAKISMPRTIGDPLEAVLINTAGGLTGGDRLDWSITVGDARVRDGDDTNLRKGLSRLVRHRQGQLPHGRSAPAAGSPGCRKRRSCSTIRHSGGRSRSTLPPRRKRSSSRRPCSGAAPWASALDGLSFADRWRVRRTRPAGPCRGLRRRSRAGEQLAAPPALGDASCVATILVLTADAEQRLDAVRAIIGDAGAASAWTVAGSGKLLARLTAEDSYDLRKRLIPLIELLNGRAGLPKVWTL